MIAFNGPQRKTDGYDLPWQKTRKLAASTGFLIVMAVLGGFCTGQLSGHTLVLNETTSVLMMSQGITQKVSLKPEEALGWREV